MNTWKVLRAVTVAASSLLLGSLVQAQQASLELSGGHLALSYANDAKWFFYKTSAVGRSLPYNEGGRIVWNVDAKHTSEVTLHEFSFFGYLEIRNDGSAPATIGNLVINLQRQVERKWGTVLSCIADATNGDGAGFALVSPTASSEGRSSFSEGKQASSIEFLDLATDMPYLISPQRSIQAGERLRLVFAVRCGYPLVFGLPEVGEPVRIEAIVSFGNAGQRGSGGAVSANLDINGNGIIDPDEASVRSVSTRYEGQMPAEVTGNREVLLTDGGVAATGTATTSGFSNSGIGSGALISQTASYAVAVDALPGAEGGFVTNTAYLDGEGVKVVLFVGDANGPAHGGAPERLPPRREFTVVPALHLQASSAVEVPVKTTLPPKDPVP